MVQCKSCLTEFPEIDPGFAMFEQALGCAATVRRNEIVGHYGCTTIDMERWRFRERPAWVRDGTICDECIKRMMAESQIEFVEKGVW
jgi:hypothetical protein